MNSAGFAHHGGRLGAARVAYSQAPQPWIDLSTGINPRSYPAPRARGVTLNRLPDTGELARLEAVAAHAFGVADAVRVVAPGSTEPALRLLRFVAGLRTNGATETTASGAVGLAATGVGLTRAAAAVIAGPTYGSHVDGWAKAGVPSRVVR